LEQVGVGFLHQCNWSPRYNWNSVESDVKHHNPNSYGYIIQSKTGTL
jgi:hypothetical protein